MKMAEQCYPRNIIRSESRSIKLLNTLGNIDITAACSMGVRDFDCPPSVNDQKESNHHCQSG
jgi:hypothetical protein